MFLTRIWRPRELLSKLNLKPHTISRSSTSKRRALLCFVPFFLVLASVTLSNFAAGSESFSTVNNEIFKHGFFNFSVSLVAAAFLPKIPSSSDLELAAFLESNGPLLRIVSRIDDMAKAGSEIAANVSSRLFYEATEFRTNNAIPIVAVTRTQFDDHIIIAVAKKITRLTINHAGLESDCLLKDARHGSLFICRLPRNNTGNGIPTLSRDNITIDSANFSIRELNFQPGILNLTAVVLLRVFPEDEAHENFARIREFLEYYRLHGVQHFFIYDNAETSSEALFRTFQYYILIGVVTYYPWYKITSRFGYPMSQSVCYNHNLHAHARVSTWQIQVDYDEFMVPGDNATRLIDLVSRAQYRDVCCITAYNRFFGSRTFDRNDTNLLMIEQYRWRSTGHDTATRYKPIVRLAALRGMEVHEAVGCSQKVVMNVGDLYMAHYWKQRAPGANQVYDDSLITRYGAELRRRTVDVAARQNMTSWGGPWPVSPT